VRRILTTLAISLVLTVSAPAQETEAEDESTETADEVASPTEEAPVEAEEIDDPTLDEPGYADTEEDDFRPSEEIQADRSISFPTDI
jgi:hypothetical protein